MNLQPTEEDWLKAWDFAWECPPDKHSIRLIIDGIKNKNSGEDIQVVLTHAGYAVLETWWMAWYPEKLPFTSLIFDAGQVLRKINHRDYVKGFNLDLLVGGDKDRPAEYDSARLELVELP